MNNKSAKRNKEIRRKAEETFIKNVISNIEDEKERKRLLMPDEELTEQERERKQNLIHRAREINRRNGKKRKLKETEKEKKELEQRMARLEELKQSLIKRGILKC